MVSEINDNECSARVGNYTGGSASGIHIDGLRGNLKKKKGYKIKYNISALQLVTLYVWKYMRDNVFRTLITKNTTILRSQVILTFMPLFVASLLFVK